MSPKYGMSSVIGGTAWTLTMMTLTMRLPRNSKRLKAYAAWMATSSVRIVTAPATT